MRSNAAPAQQQTTCAGDCLHKHGKPARITWARLLNRLFYNEIERHVQRKLKLLAATEETAVIEKILTYP